MALGVQVDALRGDVASHQDAHRCVGLAELLDDLLLLHVGQAPVHDPHRVGGQVQVLTQVLGQPGQRRDALGEDDDALGRPGADPDAAQLGQQRLVLARGRCVGLHGQLAQAGQRLGLLRGLRGGAGCCCPAAASGQALVDRLDEGRRRGQEGLGQGPGEQGIAAAGGGLAAARCRGAVGPVQPGA